MRFLLILLALLLPFTVQAQQGKRLSQLPNSGAYNPSTDNLVLVRNGAPTDYLYSFNTPVNCPASVGSLNYNISTNTYSCNPVSGGLLIDPRSSQFGSNTCTGYYGIATSTLGVGGTGYAVGDT